MSIIDILKEKGLKKTAQRVAIISVLQKKLYPLTENEIKVEMGDMYDRITFYRTIQTLLDANIIHRIIVDKLTIRYVLNTNKEEHVHFYCESCHHVTCLHNIPPLEYQLPKDFEQKECKVLIKGICNKCKSLIVVEIDTK